MRCGDRESWTLVVLLAAGCASGPSSRDAEAAPTSMARASQPPAPRCPEASTLVARWVEQMGGLEALETAERGFRATARVDGDPGPSGSLRIYFQAPHRVRSILELDSGERYEDGVDGELAWSKGPEGVRVHKGDAAASSLRRADLFGMALRYGERFAESRCVKETRVDGRSAWVVEALSPHGELETHVFDATHGRLLGLSVQAHTVIGTVRIQTRFADFRRVGALELPFEQVHKTSGVEQRVTFERFVFVPPVEEEVAAPPEVTRWAQSPAAWSGPTDAALRP